MLTDEATQDGEWRRVRQAVIDSLSGTRLSHHDREDLVQHALTATWRRLATGERPRSLSDYAVVVARNQAIDAARSRRDHEHAIDPEIADQADPLSRRESLQTIARSAVVFAGFPARWRELLWAKTFGGRSDAELSARYGVSRQGLHRRVSRMLSSARLSRSMLTAELRDAIDDVAIAGGGTEEQRRAVAYLLEVDEEARGYLAERRSTLRGARICLAPLALGAGLLQRVRDLAPASGAAPAATAVKAACAAGVVGAGAASLWAVSSVGDAGELHRVTAPLAAHATAGLSTVTAVARSTRDKRAKHAQADVRRERRRPVDRTGSDVRSSGRRAPVSETVPAAPVAASPSPPAPAPGPISSGSPTGGAPASSAGVSPEQAVFDPAVPESPEVDYGGGGEGDSSAAEQAFGP